MSVEAGQARGLSTERLVPTLCGPRQLGCMFGISQTCGGSTGGYRMDQQDDLDFLASFGITP